MIEDKSDPLLESGMASDKDCYAIFVTDVQLMPPVSGNRLRLLGFIRALRELGWKVALVAPPGAAPIEQLRLLVDDFLPVPARPFSGGYLCRFDASPFRCAVNGKAAKVRPLVAIAEYAWLGPALSDLPSDVERWIDCHDVLHERTQRFGAAGLHPWAICTWEEERQCLDCADVIITTQEREASLLQGLLPGKRVKCMLTPVDLPPGFSHSPGKGTVVLTVGGHHPGNLAVADFARNAWPRVLERIPAAQLHIVGTIGKAVSPTSGVRIFGWVPDLQAHYAAAAVVICPVTTGTGVKTKMLEALRFGKAVIATPAAVEGMPAPKGHPWIVAGSLSACAGAIADLLADPARRAEMEAAAYAFGEEHVAIEAFRAQLRSLLPTGRPDVARASQSRGLQRTVSIVVPHAGSLQQLRTCLKLLVDQSYPRSLFEIIVVAQAVSPVVYAAIADEYPGTVVIREPAAGPAAARNRGAAYGRSAFVAFLDSDCRVHREWLANAVRVAEEQTGDCVAACGIRPLLSCLCATGVAWYNALVLHERRHAREPHCGASSILMRRGVWELIGPFNEAYSEASWEGHDWVQAAIARGVRIVNAPEAMVAHPVKGTWGALRSQARRLARGERLQAIQRGDAIDVESKLRIARTQRLKQELRLALRNLSVPWTARPGVAMAAALVWRWSAAETGCPPAAPGALTATHCRVFGDTRETSRLPLRSVSVIVPCLGWPDTLPACLDALRKQMIDGPMEIIVVVNGPDAPAAGHCPPEIRVVRVPRCGPAAARNAGVCAASGDVLAFIDSDCVPSPRWLAAGLAVLRSGAAEHVVAGAITRSGARRSWVALYDSANYLRQADYVHGSTGFVTANLLVHRTVFDRIGPFDVVFNEAAFEDQEWAMRAQDLGIPVSYAANAIVDHPCMLRLGEVRRKAERLVRGALLMQRKLGQPAEAPSLFATLCGEVRKAFWNRSLSLGDRLRLICVGVVVGFSGWRAGRRHRDLANAR
jgi:glycosyltransferase involved in cell wall biosynthesis